MAAKSEGLPVEWQALLAGGETGTLACGIARVGRPATLSGAQLVGLSI